MQDENLQFSIDRMTKLDRICRGDLCGNCDVAGKLRRVGREGENVGWLVLPAEAEIQLAHLRTRRDADAQFPACADRPFCFCGEQGQGALVYLVTVVLQNDHFRFKNKWEGKYALPQYGTKLLLGNAIRRRQHRGGRHFRQWRLALDAGRVHPAVARTCGRVPAAVLQFER